MADIKTAYGTSTAMTITLASSPASATLVAGRESTALVNTSNLYEDYLLSGKITTGTSPTATSIRIYAYAQLFATGPVYPDVMDGTDSVETFASVEARDSALVLAKAISVNTSNDITYWFGAISIRALFGEVPAAWGVWVTQDTGAILNATGSNHAIWHQGVYRTAA